MHSDNSPHGLIRTWAVALKSGIGVIHRENSWWCSSQTLNRIDHQEIQPKLKKMLTMNQWWKAGGEGHKKMSSLKRDLLEI